MGSVLVSIAVDRHLVGGGSSTNMASVNTPANNFNGDVNTCLHHMYWREEQKDTM